MGIPQKAEGILLRKYPLRETSYILVFFTREFGKIRGVIKGIRAPYPQYAGNFEVFSLCRLLFYRRKKTPLDLVTQCEAVEPFFSVRKDIERLTYANYFIELLDMATTDHDPSEGLFDVLADGLGMLDGEMSAKRAARIFELGFLKETGMSPQISSCVSCGKAPEGKYRFSVSEGGLLCGGCAADGRKALEISPGVVNFIRKIQESDTAMSYRIKVSREVGGQTERILRDFLVYHMARPIRSLKFLDRLQKDNII